MMNFKLICRYFLSSLLVILASGCQLLPQTSEDTDSNTNTSIQVESLECPEIPVGTLESPEEIDIKEQRVRKTGRVRSGDDIGFIFHGQEGQRINYSYNDKLCVWIYTPNNNLLTDVELPIDGMYTVQVASLRGTTTFEIEMSLSEPIVSATPTPTPTETPSPNRSPSPRATEQPTQSSNSSSSSSTQPTSNFDLTQSQAVNLINNWLNNKSQVFSHPFDRSVARQYTYTQGPLYHDITKPGGSIDWLRSNNAYYRYENSRITDINSFSLSGPRPELFVTIYEERTMHTPTGVDRSSSGAGSRRYAYSFFKENGTWKIFDYRPL